MTTATQTPRLEENRERGSHSLQRLVGRHSWALLINADCRDVREQLQADAIISDPPYGMKWDGRVTVGPNGHNFRGAKTTNHGKTILHDDEPFDPAPWLEYPAVVLFGSNHYAQRLPVGTTLVWLKRFDEGFGSFLSDAEVAWMKGGHGVYVKRDTSLKADEKNRLHQNQKPVPIMAWCLDMAKVPKGATVCDPYMGSGSTGIACLRTGRNFIGVEKDATHYATALERMRSEVEETLL